jgi:hypothetical protein
MSVNGTGGTPAQLYGLQLIVAVTRGLSAHMIAAFELRVPLGEAFQQATLPFCFRAHFQKRLSEGHFDR